MPDGFMWDDYAMDYVPVHVIQAEEEARRMDGGGTFEETKTIATLDMQVNALRLEVLNLLSKCECLEMINLGLKTERDRLSEAVRIHEVTLKVLGQRCEKLQALVREMIEPKPVRMTTGGVVLSDEYMDRANELLARARALVGEVD